MTTTTLPGRGRSPRPLHLIGLLVILMAVGLGYAGLKTSVRPYTTQIVEAERSGRSVQLVGFLGSTGDYDAQGRFTFVLQDETGREVTIVYSGVKPANFEQATSIVAIGRYDRESGGFLADELLVKCPSKYHEEGQ